MKKWEAEDVLRLTSVPPDWRAAIGIIKPSSSRATERDYWLLFPDGVVPLITRVMFETPSEEDYIRAGEEVEHAVRLLASANPDCISYACTAGSFIKGVDYDREIIAGISRITGKPATTMANAVVEALRAIGAENIVMVAPYPDDIVATEVRYFTDQGFNVVYQRGLNMSSGYDKIAPSELYSIAVEAFRQAPPRVDATFISCGGLRAIGILDWVEKATGVPCVHSTQCNAWHCLKLAGIHEPIHGFGRLLEMPR